MIFSDVPSAFARTSDGSWLRRLAWASWRQHRATLIGLGLFLAVVAAAVIVAGLRIHQLNDAALRAGCPVNAVMTAQCRAPLRPFGFGWIQGYQEYLQLLLPLVPVVIGMFAGAPLLAREYADGTSHFAWVQGAGRTRPVLTKILLIGLAMLVAAAVIGWLVQWSAGPVVARSLDFDHWYPALFNSSPLTLAARAGLFFALGLLAGVVIRRPVPAMAVTAAAAITFLIATYNRLHYWLLGFGLRQAPDPALGRQAYPAGPGSLVNLHEAARARVPGPAGSWLDQGWYTGPQHTFWVSYQPGGRYLLFQSAQGGAELLAAILLGVLAVWLVRRRRA
jgi:ABC-2 family transporter protein